MKTATIKRLSTIIANTLFCICTHGEAVMILSAARLILNEKRRVRPRANHRSTPAR